MTTELPSSPQPEGPGPTNHQPLRRLGFFLLALATMLAGLASRHFRDQLPDFLASYAGDTLWAMMVFWLVSSLVSSWSLRWRMALALSFCFAIEISQLHHGPRLEALRQTGLGSLVLGFGFLWSDLVCYTLGVLAAGAMVHLVSRASRPAN